MYQTFPQRVNFVYLIFRYTFLPQLSLFLTHGNHGSYLMVTLTPTLLSPIILMLQWTRQEYGYSHRLGKIMSAWDLNLLVASVSYFYIPWFQHHLSMSSYAITRYPRQHLKGTIIWAVFGRKRIHSTLYWKGSIVSAGIRTPDPWVAKRTIYHWATWLDDELA